MNKIVIGTTMLTLMASVAFAQPSPSSPAPMTPAPAAPAVGSTSQPSAGSAQPANPSKTGSVTSGPSAAEMPDPGMKMANSATMAVKFITVQPADFMSTRLMGVNVYNNQNETVGEIEDLVIENGKTLKGVVLGVGGFLGMGESYVVLDPATVVLNQKDGSWRAYVDTSKDTLKNAPKFTYTKMKK